MNQTTPIRMPTIFFGHGSPMNALDDNKYTRAWEKLGASIPKPKAILAISAHWYTQGTGVTAMAAPRTIHDFGGFPQALFDMRYPAPGNPALASRVRALLAPLEVHLDHDWGLDHGTWSVLVKAYPQADIPVIQLSIDGTRPPAWHLELGRRLQPLRDEGILIIATGDTVHNLRRMERGGRQGFDWAERFEQQVKERLLGDDIASLADYEQWGEDAQLSVPTPEHFLPLLYIAGTKRDDEKVTLAVEGIEMGSISMMTAVVGLDAVQAAAA